MGLHILCMFFLSLTINTFTAPSARLPVCPSVFVSFALMRCHCKAKRLEKKKSKKVCRTISKQSRYCKSFRSNQLETRRHTIRCSVGRRTRQLTGWRCEDDIRQKAENEIRREGFITVIEDKSKQSNTLTSG